LKYPEKWRVSAFQATEMQRNAYSMRISSLTARRIYAMNDGSGGMMGATTSRWGAGGALVIPSYRQTGQCRSDPFPFSAFLPAGVMSQFGLMT
jgi:hypothetical protein